MPQILNKSGKALFEYTGELREANLSGAVLREANLSGADLRGANLRGAVLREANLSGADLRGADLRGAVLREANLSGADLRGADLRRADLREADLRGADLRCKQYILHIVGSRGSLIAIDGDVRIGCEQHPLEWWIENCQDMGRRHQYSPREIAEYRGYLSLVLHGLKLYPPG